MGDLDSIKQILQSWNKKTQPNKTPQNFKNICGFFSSIMIRP